jgi:hypothetical protein
MNKLIKHKWEFVYMTIAAVIFIALQQTVFASANQELSKEEKESGFYTEGGFPKYNKDRPAINPDFAPDEDCNLVYELKCLPGTEQECPEGYNGGDDNSCSPKECQEGYHYEDEDETGLCYPNDEGCGDYGPYVLIEGKYGDRCALLYFICDEAEHREEDYCLDYLED